MYCIIMAGGKGTRFWPRSRGVTPKQLLDIIGDKTLIQQTVERVSPLVAKDHIIIVTAKDQAAQIKELLPDIPESNLLVEPTGRNTAPCICLAAVKIQKIDPGATMVVLPADHYIRDASAFCRCIEAAQEAAHTTDALVTIGISPTRPETGYGYIQFAEAVTQCKGVNVYRVTGFHEKPTFEKACTFLKQGSFLWNSGIFIWKLSVILSAIQHFLPETYQSLVQVAPLLDTPDADAALAAAYSRIPSISIDYGVMEKAQQVLTLKGDFGWDDIGSWSALYEISKKDSNGNALRGEVITRDAHNILAYSPKKLTAVIGISDTIIVETDDVLLVCAKDKAQDVKKLVELLEEQGRYEYL